MSCSECDRVSRYMSADPEMYRGEERLCDKHRTSHDGENWGRAMTDPSALDLERLRRFHFATREVYTDVSYCDECSEEMPCTVLRLCDEIDRLRAQVARECLCDGGKPHGRSLCNIHAVEECAELISENDRLRAENERYRELLQLPLMFHAAGSWSESKIERWARICGGVVEATTRVMCDTIRAALDEKENRE